MLGNCRDFFSPKNTSLVIHDASYYKPDVANVFYVALIYVKDKEPKQFNVSYTLVILKITIRILWHFVTFFFNVPTYYFMTALSVINVETAF